MNRLALAASLALLPASALIALACGGDYGHIRVQPHQARAAHNELSTTVPVDQLRAEGPPALRRLLDRYDQTSDSTLLPAIDAVAAQKDAVWSRLFWHTDLDAAKSAAAAERKPILYLRMLGKLTDEYSCANSRFFRTVLYADPTVAQLLRERFILVWQSERPVPVASIDFGDGRVLKRTITGNSIHYVLTPEGEVVDALPGLMDSSVFTSTLAAAADAALGSADERREYTGVSLARTVTERQLEVAALAAAPATGPALHQVKFTANDAAAQSFTKTESESPVVRALSERTEPVGQTASSTTSARDAALRARGKTLVESPLVNAVTPDKQEKLILPVPNAAAAAPISPSKMRAEVRVVNAVVPAPATVANSTLEGPDLWSRIAEPRIGRTNISADSIALIRAQNPALDADPALLARTLANFRRSIAEDTVRNTLDFRAQVLRWMIESPTPIAVEDLNRRVYAELFLTPSTDPWLGLVPDATYSALENDGCSVH